MELEETVARLIIEQDLRLAVAETTCGGLVSARLLSVSGSSAYFDRGVVAYSRAAKVDMLGVPAELLDEHGAVSEEVVGAMAEAVQRTSGVDIGIAETGIAGPRRGRSSKPIGTGCIAVATTASTKCETHQFGGDRVAIREAIADGLLRLLTTCLNEEGAGSQ